MLVGSKAIGTVAFLAGLPSVLTEFMRAMVRLMIFSREALCNPLQHIHFDDVSFSDHGPARNQLVNKFLGDWLLMIDADHAPEPDLLARMMNRMTAYNLDVLVGLYRFKSPPCSPVLYARSKPDAPLLPIARWPQGIFQIQAAGAGCLLVRRSVFEAIQAAGEEPFDRMPGLSEDHSFFRRLEKLGIKAWCDGRIECPHLRVEPVLVSQDDEYTVSEPFAVEGVR